MFISMGWNCVSKLRPQPGLLFILQMVHKYGATVKWHWNWLGENPVKVPLRPPQIPLGRTDPGANPFLYGERPATSGLRHVTAIYIAIMAVIIKPSWRILNQSLWRAEMHVSFLVTWQLRLSAVDQNGNVSTIEICWRFRCAFLLCHASYLFLWYVYEAIPYFV